MDRDTLRLLAGFAHDLRTPLSAIAGHSTLLSMGVHGPVSEAQAYALGRVEDNQKQLSALIGDFLRYAEAVSGTIRQSLGACALRSIVAHTVGDAQATALATGVHLKWLDDDHAGISNNATSDHSSADIALVNESATREIVAILLEDAMTRSDRGSQVEVRLQCTTNTLQVVVDSYGPAIAEDSAELLFVPFARDSSGREVHAPGRPLSLPYARALARTMGADVLAVNVASRRVLQLEVTRSANFSPLMG